MLHKFSSLVTSDWLSLTPGSRLAAAVEFFIYDTLKIFLLLSVIIFTVSIIRSYFPPERTKQILSNKKEFIGNILAALLGIVTPFCSCSAVPLFIGFIEAGVPLGVTFSFLISSPMVNEVAVVLLWGLFGWKVAALYAGIGLIVAMLAGMLIGRLRLEKWVELAGTAGIARFKYATLRPLRREEIRALRPRAILRRRSSASGLDTTSFSIARSRSRRSPVARGASGDLAPPAADD